MDGCGTGIPAATAAAPLDSGVPHGVRSIVARLVARKGVRTDAAERIREVVDVKRLDLVGLDDDLAVGLIQTCHATGNGMPFGTAHPRATLWTRAVWLCPGSATLGTVRA